MVVIFQYLIIGIGNELDCIVIVLKMSKIVLEFGLIECRFQNANA